MSSRGKTLVKLALALNNCQDFVQTDTEPADVTEPAMFITYPAIDTDPVIVTDPPIVDDCLESTCDESAINKIDEQIFDEELRCELQKFAEVCSGQQIIVANVTEEQKNIREQSVQQSFFVLDNTNNNAQDEGLNNQNNSVTKDVECSAPNNFSDRDNHLNTEDMTNVSLTNPDSSFEYNSSSESSDELTSEEENVLVKANESEKTLLPDEPKNKKARKGQANYREWTITKNQRKRQEGLAYYGLGKESSGKWKYNIQRAERKLKPPCNCALSKKKSKIQCTQFSEEDRTAIFKYFWTLTWREKKVFVRTLIDEEKTRDTKNQKNETSRRQRSLFFYLKRNNVRIRVCKKMFLNTLSLNEWCALNWLKKKSGAEEVSEESQCQSDKKNRYAEGREHIRNFLMMLPKVESHYCRKSTSKEYLEPIWRSKSNLFREYERYCADKEIKSLKFKVFEDVFRRLNLSIFMPKKDQCDLCIGYKTKNVSTENYEMHQIKKQEARKEKEQDKENAKFVFTMDLQSVLLCPVLKASAIYYKTKLVVHNFTIFNLKNSEGYCYLWDESEGSLSANEFASIICHFINTEIPFSAGDEIILYSDGCCYQNRNATLCNALLNLAIRHNVTIVQKILEKGHTQMECDSMHSSIERRLRNQDIYTPAGYIDACKHARIKPKPYNVKYLHHNFFRNYNQACCTFYKSIRPGNKTGDPVVTDIRAISYNPNGRITYKLRHTECWQQLPQRIDSKAKSCLDETIPNLHRERLKIKKEKWNHLQTLKDVLEAEYHHFYDSLPHD